MRRAELTLWLVLGGCGPHVSTSSSGGGEGEGAGVDAGPEDDRDVGDEDDGADVPEPQPDLGEPNPCSNGEILCGANCIDPQSDDAHCGRCDNECKNVANLGGCEEGTCPPNYECGGARTDYRDCNEVCEALGTSCVDGLGCSGSHNFFFGMGGVELCEAGLSGTNSEPDALCSDPIDWNQIGGLDLEPPVAVACCCLQE